MTAFFGFWSTSFLYACTASLNSLRAIMRSAISSADKERAPTGVLGDASCEGAWMERGANAMLSVGLSLDCPAETAVTPRKRTTTAGIASRKTFMANLLCPVWPDSDLVGLGRYCPARAFSYPQRYQKSSSKDSFSCPGP